MESGLLEIQEKINLGKLKKGETKKKARTRACPKPEDTIYAQFSLKKKYRKVAVKKGLHLNYLPTRVKTIHK